MMEELVACKVWEEPNGGQLVGEFYDSNQAAARLGSTNFVMGNPTTRRG
jgi:hypothetical protein